MISAFDRSLLRSFEFWASCVAFIATGLFVAPVARWIAEDALAKEQVLHPFIVLSFAAIMLLQYHRLRLRLSLKIDNTALFHLGVCYALAAVSLYTNWAAIAIMPLVFYLAALTRFVFGEKHYKLAGPLLVAFAVFLILAVYLPYFDWPLREMAGRAVAWTLANLGFDATLSVRQSEQQLMLVLDTGGQLFHVAPECNGYGTISSVTLVCIITMLALKSGWKRLALALALCLPLAFVANALRILVITQLARPFSERYNLMHEIVGNIALFACLYATWLICARIARTR